MSSSDDMVQENAYLALREAKIKRNDARLRELGLIKSLDESPTDRTSESSPLFSNETPQRKRGATELSFNEKSPPSLPLRRSRRLADQPQEFNYKDVTSELESRKKQPRVVTPIARKTSAYDVLTTYTATTAKIAAAPRRPPAANSVRSISLCSQRLVLGSNDTPSRTGVLGLSMDQTGKEFVIQNSFDNAASTEDRQRLQGRRLSFNKYSGVQEWQDCVFLWVNLGAKGNTVVNKFIDDGQQITWFGGRLMFNDTPVIEKLIRWGREATDSSSRIILWCRRYQKEQNAFSPYVCLGRLSYQSHDPNSYPLAFVWNLLDSNRLIHHKDAQVRETFQQFWDES